MVLLVLSVNLTPVQNFLAKKATQTLARKLNTTVSVRHVRIDFLNHVLIQGLYIQDHQKDTLLYAGEASIRITDWFFLKKDKPVIKFVGLKDAYAHLYRTAENKVWNYQFVIDAFDSGPSDKTKSKNEFELDLKQVELHNVRFHMDDAWVGSDMDFDVADFELDGNEIDLKKKNIDLDLISAEDLNIVMRDYTGGRPVDPNRKKKPVVLDTTAFNPDNWVVKIAKLELDNCLYSLTSSTKPAPVREFDPEHLEVSKFVLDARNIRINGDTLTGRIRQLAAQERCGLAIRELEADVTVSPNVTELRHLLLKTDKSILKDYYAMHYERFPDFTDYIAKVKMDASLEDAVISGDEVGYFAPVLREYKATIKASGKIYGTVDSLSGSELFVNDGTSTVQGNIVMIGLPDIDETFIRYTNGNIQTSGQAILHYAPTLREDPNIDVERLSFIHFNGGFTGYISNFATSGTLKTNLGTVTTTTKLMMPGMDARLSKYSSTVAAQNFDLGLLLRQPYLGTISFKADVSGNSFDIGRAGITVNAFINQLWFYGHNYKNITAEGVLAGKKFDGKILVDDESLALAFNGAADFSGDQPIIKATANLLKSNLMDLKLTEEPVSAVADLDLNMTGSNLDNFLGSAKLYNINLLRGSHRVDVDSVTLDASLTTNGKMLTIASNDLEAHISGSYQLSQLPYSTQYFLSRYMPGYIRAPKKYAPDQDITFDVITRNIDSVLAVAFPIIRGFDNSSVVGSMNTTTQQLTLLAKVPYGSIGSLYMKGVTLTGNGDFSSMKLSGDAESILVGDSLVQLSLNFNTTIGNDSASFNIITSSPGAYGTATLNGGAVALGDSLLVSMQPSEIFFSGNRWEIPGGSKVVVGAKYLVVRDLFLNSGLQKIAIRSENEKTDQRLLIDLQNIDLAQLGSIAEIEDYNPDGRLNGTVRVEKMFGDLMVDADMKASNVKFGLDTLGDIVIAGQYNAAKQIIMLEEGSGIFRDGASVAAQGSISFDSTSKQQLDGRIRFIDAPISWISPFLKGFVSNMGGVINGNVKLAGSGRAPDVDGSISLSKAVFKVEYLGTSYTIPAATIGLSNKSIDLNAITVYDAFDNTATLSGAVTHDRFKNFRLNVQMVSKEFEVLNLKDYENEVFYGNLIAKTDVRVRGLLNDITMTITAAPAKQSHLFLPISSGNSVGSYNYVSFKKYGTDQTYTSTSKNKLSINIDANLNPLAEITMILDPSTGDQINAKGYGNLKINIPADGDLKMYNTFNIEEGNYTFTFRQLFFKRQFIINSGSQIKFNGPIAQTNLAVNATYRTRASLYDLLSEDEKKNSFVPASELSDTKRMQDINVILTMTERLQRPTLTFKLDLPEKRSVGTYAYSKLERINANDRQLFDQVASLLLIGYFIPPEGIAGSTAATGAINNMSEIISTTTSGQLTNIVNKLLGDPKLQIELKYKNYNLSDGATNNPLNRNEVKLGLRQNFFNDRLVVELGSAYDWGRPTAANTSTSNFNLLNNFRLQYLLNREGRLRLNGFRTSDYDVLLNAGQYITRAGIGLSWRKSFNSFSEFIHSEKYYERKLEQLEQMNKTNSDSSLMKRTIGTE